MKTNALVILGAIAGALLGYFAFRWLLTQGFYGLILPGGLAGMGAGLFSNKSRTVAIMCGIIALAAGVLSEWAATPFIKDASLKFFVMHLHELSLVTLLMIGVGTVLGFNIPHREIYKK